MPLPQYHAARPFPPEKCSKFRMKDLTDGVSAVVCQPKGGGGWEIQSVRFDKTKFTPQEARDWLKKHDFSSADFEEASGDGAAAGADLASQILIVRHRAEIALSRVRRRYCVRRSMYFW